MGKVILFLKRYFYLLLFAVAITPVQLSAQVNNQVGVYDEGMRPKFDEPANPEETARERTSGMKRQLKLSPEQFRSVYRINLYFEKAYQEQLSQSPGMTEYDKAILGKIRKEQMDSLQKVLTGEQWQMFTQKRDRHRIAD